MKLIPHRLTSCLNGWYSEFASIWYSSRRPHRNSALPPTGMATAAPQRISGRTS